MCDLIALEKFWIPLPSNSQETILLQIEDEKLMVFTPYNWLADGPF